jgi:hypothetical protein
VSILVSARRDLGRRDSAHPAVDDRPTIDKPPKGLSGAWLLASVAGAFEPKDRYGARGRTGELSNIESV